ncbi:CHASE2 domain-containing sensor protein [Roseateles asaccharophilus]|uniref:CHASE2 domain-containing protein n=1 Tax=Roseateles asaccharophilus TaxID=582607 RepID=UPI0038374271
MSMLRTTTALIFALILGQHALAGSNETSSTAKPGAMLVLIDDASTVKLGAMPIDRLTYVKAIQRGKALGAKSVTIKLFLESPTNRDSELAAAMQSIPVFLQTRSGGVDRNPLPGLMRQGSIPNPLELGPLVLPQEVLLKQAAGVGFVDARLPDSHDRVELFATVQKAGLLPSLQLLLAENITSSRATVVAGRLTLGGRSFEIDQEGRAKCPYLQIRDASHISIESFLDSKLNESLIRGKTVIVGYGRSDSPKIDVGLGNSVPVHEYFFRQVLCLAGGR